MILDLGNKFIIDTNIIFAALYSPKSLAGKIIDLALERKIELFAPEEVKEELVRNLQTKLDYNKNQIKTTLESLPITWLNHKMYANFIKKAKQNISSKDAPILAASYFSKLPIITGDKEFFNLKGANVLSLREVLKLL